jgi:hypothetical protein
MNRLINISVAAAIILSASACRTLTPEEAAYQREFILRAVQMQGEWQMNNQNAQAIRAIGCGLRDYCYYP